MSIIKRPLLSLISELQPVGLSEIMHRIFTDMARLLGYLDLIEIALQRDNAEDEIVHLFLTIQVEALYLIAYMEDKLSLSFVNEALAKALDSTIFATRLEMQRVYEQELSGLAAATSLTKMRGRVLEAHELLRNCFQQSIIVIARIFDPTFNSDALFLNARSRREQSLMLQEDLEALLRIARFVEHDTSEFPRSLFETRLEYFHLGSRRYLMQQDWERFEEFVARYQSSQTEAEIKQFLNGFNTYLELLFDHVSKRGELSAL